MREDENITTSGIVNLNPSKRTNGDFCVDENFLIYMVAHPSLSIRKPYARYAPGCFPSSIGGGNRKFTPSW